jgi:hypothetical protein
MPKGMEQPSRRLHHFKTRLLAGFSSLQGFGVRPTILSVNHLPPCLVAYVAGLVDADGTVTLARKHHNENRHPAISISNTDRELLESVLQAIGADKITSKRTSNKHHAPSFTYAVYNRQALRLLERIQPFLRTYKRKRAELILQDYLLLTPRNGRYTDESLTARKAFEAKVLAIKPRRATN